MSKELTLHGSVFLLLKRFVETEYGADNWQNILRACNLSRKIYELHQNYPLADMQAMILEAGILTGLSESDLKEKFGEKMAPDLMTMYKRYADPSWKTFELLEYTEMVMHKAVRKEESTANPPIINVSRVHDKLLIIDYYSERRMGSLAVGLIKGIARYYNEEKKVTVLPLSNPNDERVQIRVEFK